MTDLMMSTGLNDKLKVNQPEISFMPDQTMIVVTITGDPNQATAKLMPPLYTTAYAIRKQFKDNGRPYKVEKLRGRWPNAQLGIAKENWKGYYALPVPNTVQQLPELPAVKNPEHIDVRLETWHYGKVAMILHIGPYTTEEHTVNQLLEFIQQQGYHPITGSHEEIYLSDPNKTASEKLKTLILYRIK